MTAATITNDEFLHAIFGEAGDNRPVVVSFAGDPDTVAQGAWFGVGWRDDAVLPATANNYFSLAAFRPDDAGKYRRQKSRFSALYSIVLDDVGTKVNAERITLPPSWKLETSSGNFQAGYILREPLTDGALADRLVNATIAAELCDPGANGPMARLVRLPVGTNGKEKNQNFPCKMESWSPEVRYSVDEIVSGLQLDMTGKKQTTEKKRTAGKAHPSDGDPVYTPRPTDNAVLVALKARGLYKSDLGNGKHDIRCPWVTEHSEAVDSGAAYFEPSDQYPIGGFRCLHGHCSGRHISDLLMFLGIERSAARMTPTIRVIGGEMGTILDAAERELAQTKKYYQRGGLIVSVITDPGTRETRVQDISQNALARALGGAATWERYDKRSSEWEKTDPPQRHVAVLWDSPSYPHLPVLNGLARQPYLRPDGSLMTVPGYDAPSGMFGAFTASDFDVPDSPTREDAETSLMMLKDLLAEFSFAKESDLAGALSAMLTAAIRPSLPTAPMYHVRAHTKGSGKSYLCELISAFATPQRGTPMTFPSDNDEMQKILLSALLRSPATIEFDNLTGDLAAFASLCTILSADHFDGRILGVSKTATVSTRTLFLSSGNNVGPVGDMTRRTITGNLEPLCEVPSARKFTRPRLVEEVLADRGRYVAAALAIVRAWIVAGRPRADVQPMGGFTDWSDLCRQSLLWLGCADAHESVTEAMATDPDRELLGRLLVAWQTVLGKRPVMLRDAVKAATYPEGNAELYEVFYEIAERQGEINRRILGWWIKRHSGRIVDGRRFVDGGENSTATPWRVETI